MHQRLPLLASLLAALMMTAPAVAQKPDQAELQKRYEAKLAKKFLPFGGWITDYDQARKIAKAQGKLIFAYFSRSYAH